MSEVVEKPAWMSQLPDSHKENETLSQFKSIGDLGSKFLELDGETKQFNEKLANYIPKLGETPSTDEVMAYRKAIGVPEKPEDYKLERPTLPEGMPYDEAFEQSFLKNANELGLTDKQVQGLYKMYIDTELGIHNEATKFITENRDKAVNALKDIWKGDAYQENREKAKKSFEKFIEAVNPPETFGGVEGVKTWFANNGLGDDPVTIWFFSQMFDRISDDTFIKGMLGTETKELEHTPSGTPYLSFPSMKKE